MNFLNKSISAAAIAMFFLVPNFARSAIIFESALAGPGGVSGITIGGSSKQIYGAAFSINQVVQVDGIGGTFFSQGSGFPSDIFGAIISLPSIDAIPTGNPFTGPEVIGTTVFSVLNTSGADVSANLAVVLFPGSYAVVFGNDHFGSSGTAAAPPAGNILSSHYLVWNTNSSGWQGGTGYSRFFVTGTTVPEPTSMVLGLSAILGLIAVKRKRKLSLFKN